MNASKPAPKGPVRRGVLAGIAVLGVACAVFVAWGVKRVAQRTLPCAGTPAALRAFDPPVHFDVYLSHFDAKTEALASELEALVKLYSASDPRVTYTVHETDSAAGVEAARAAGLYPNTIPSPDPTSHVALGQFTMGALLSSGTARAAMSLVARTPERGSRDLDLRVRRALRRLRVGRAARIGVMPPGEISSTSVVPWPASSDSGEPVPVDAATPIDPTLDGLIVLARHEFDDTALREVDAFLMRGKPVVFAGGPADVRYDTLSRFDFTPMHALVGKYGVVLHSDLVFDFDDGRPADPSTDYAGWSFFARPADGERSLGSPLFAHEDQTIVMTPSSVELEMAAQPHASARVLARTSDRGYLLTATGTRLAKWSPKDVGLQPRAYDVAAEVQGPLTSAYGLGESAPGARVIVVGGWLRSVVDLYDWFAEDEDARSCGEGSPRP